MRCRKSPDGIALVLVLALIVLVTVVVVAFLSRSSTEQLVSASSVSASKADMLARSACDAIIGDLKDEIAAGSTANVTNGVTIYIPRTKNDTVPSRILGTAPNHPPNLVKYSKQGAAFYTTSNGTGPILASAVSSTASSLNGRSISPDRWNKPYLLPRDPALVSSGSVGTTPDSNYFSAPDWVMVTRQGAAVQSSIGSGDSALNNPASTNLNYVIGRYAFMIYDEGGLLDINTAGYPTSPTALAGNALKAFQTTYGHKGGAGCADLTQIMSSGTSLLTPTDINNLIGWRNYASAKFGGTFGAYAYSSVTATNYYNYLTSSTAAAVAGMTVASGSYNGLTDQMILSRQQLIQLRRGVNGLAGSGFNQDALQYLGTFSREKNAPSYVQPTNDPNRPNIDSNFNPDILSVRFQNDVPSLTRYRLDGTSNYTVSVKAGEPLVQMRFPLGRLAWLTSSGPAPGTEAAIKQHFGLVWDSSVADHPRWKYVSPDGDAMVSGTVRTLSQVSQRNREPDFFELLKAGILRGSLGKTANDPQLAGTVDDKGAWITAAEDVNCDLQILRIGANIIDQYDADSIPTGIHFSNNEVTVAKELDVYGTESLPYVSIIPLMTYRPLIDSTRSTVGGWFSFVMWDPHMNSDGDLQNVVKNANATNYPRNFRIHPIPDPANSMMAVITLSVNLGQTLYNSGTAVGQISGPGAVAPPCTLNASDYITFSRDPAASPFHEPTLLQPRSLGGSSASNNSMNVVTIAGAEQAGSFVGFSVGSVVATTMTLPPQTSGTFQNGSNTITAWVNGYSFGVSSTAYPCFEVQCQNPATGTWHTYQQIKKMRGLGGVASGIKDESPHPFYNPSAGWKTMFADPRTARFGGHPSHNGTDFRNPAPALLSIWSDRSIPGEWGGIGYTSPYWFDTLQGARTRNHPGEGDIFVGSLCYNKNDGSLNSAMPANPARVYYYDPDGVSRQGDAAKGLFPMAPASATMAVDRPLILNRPFRSVAELSYAFKDIPWRSIDFWSAKSPDSALLDLFSVADSEVVAGKVNLNTKNPAVLQALLSGAQMQAEIPNESTANVSTATTAVLTGTQTTSQAVRFASALVAQTTGTAFQNPSDLVFEFAKSTYDGNNYFASGNQQIVNGQRNAPLRALADAVTTRTWNLMIDVIAQTGRYAKSASASDPLDQFVVEGERRYWLHIAIDRFTGEIIDQQWEVVNE